MVPTRPLKGSPAIKPSRLRPLQGNGAVQQRRPENKTWFSTLEYSIDAPTTCSRLKMLVLCGFPTAAAAAAAATAATATAAAAVTAAATAAAAAAAAAVAAVFTAAAAGGIGL